MATRKKSPKRKGLVHGPSRKQYDGFNTKTGDKIEFPERRETSVYTATRTTAGSTTFYTTPAGKRAKVIFVSLYAKNTAGVALYLDASLVVKLPDVATSSTQWTQYLGYENGIDLKSGQTLVITNLSNSSEGVATVWIVEEDASGAYLNQLYA